MEERETLVRARKAMRQGDKATAQRLLYQVLRTDARNVTAWLWLSAIVDDPAREQECLERVLAIDPSNEIAQRHLDQLTQAEIPQPTPGQAAVPHIGPGSAQPTSSQTPRIVASPTTESQPAKGKWTGHILLLATAALLAIACLSGSCCVLLSREAPAVDTPRSTPSPTWPATWTPTTRATPTLETAAVPVDGSLWCPDCAAEGMPINLWERGSSDRGRVIAKGHHGDKVVVLDRNHDASEGRYYYEVGVLETGAIGWVPETLIQLGPQVEQATIIEGEVVYHVVQEGDTLASIAAKYAVSPERIAELNDIQYPDAIGVGQKLIISVPGDWSPSPDPTPVPETPALRLSNDEILAARRLYSAQLLSWDMRPQTRRVDCLINLQLDVTNGSTVQLAYLTLRVDQFDSKGELLGWGRTAAQVAQIAPSETRRVSASIPGGFCGVVATASTVSVSIEENPSPDDYRFFEELH